MTNGGYLTLDQIKGSKDINFADVPIPEWDGTVRIKSLTAAERAQFEAKLMTIQQRMRIGGAKKSDEEQYATVNFHAHEARVLLVTLSIVDEHGNRMFDADEAGLKLVGSKGDGPIRRIYDAATKLNGMDSEAQKELAGESDAAGAAASS